MTLLRALLAGALLTLIVVWPALTTPVAADTAVTVVNAAPATDSRHPEKEEKNRNENWNENGNSNGNGNGNGNDNGNEVDDGDDTPKPGPNQRNRRGGPSSSTAPASTSSAERCFAAGQSGAVTLHLDGGTVTLTVVSTSAFPRASRVSLAKVDPALVPAPPGPRLDEILFEIRAQEGCDGAGLGELLADANLGTSYRVPADKATLRYAMLDGSRWVDVPTTPDPSNPYVSATVQRVGIYTVYQAR